MFSALLADYQMFDEAKALLDAVAEYQKDRDAALAGIGAASRARMRETEEMHAAVEGAPSYLREE
jgi:hypothetical protein